MLCSGSYRNSTICSRLCGIVSCNSDIVCSRSKSCYLGSPTSSIYSCCRLAEFHCLICSCNLTVITSGNGRCHTCKSCGCRRSCRFGYYTCFLSYHTLMVIRCNFADKCLSYVGSYRCICGTCRYCFSFTFPCVSKVLANTVIFTYSCRKSLIESFGSRYGNCTEEVYGCIGIVNLYKYQIRRIFIQIFGKCISQSVDTYNTKISVELTVFQICPLFIIQRSVFAKCNACNTFVSYYQFVIVIKVCFRRLYEA